MPDEDLPPSPSEIDEGMAGELFARAMHSVRMTSSAGPHGWEPPPIEEAAQLFPQYEVLGLIGRGGMGAVYQARQRALDRFVAIKLLPLEVSANQDFSDRFVREARAMAKLNHPNIIAVYDFGTTSEGHLYFVMEYVEGANLHDVIQRVGLSPEQALSIAGQVCAALAYAHGKGVVHRDIKPANVMIDTDSHAKVADFGLARLIETGTEPVGRTVTGTVMGTPDYMAPEQKRGMNVDHRADIYSIGVMIYEMLCRETPQGAFEPPSIRIGCDARIDDVVLKAMQPAPERRYQDTKTMKVEIERIRATPIARIVAAAPLPKPPALVLKPASATPEPAKSAALRYAGIAVAVIAVVGAFLFLARSQPKRATTAPASEAARSIPATGEATPQPASLPVEQRPVTATSIPPLEPGAIKLWDTPDKLPKSARARWEDGAVVMNSSQSLTKDSPRSRDAIVRAAIRRGTDGIDSYVGLRAGKYESGRVQPTYYLQPDFRNNSVALRCSTGEKSIYLKSWRLPRPVETNEWVRLELRAVGDELTVSADGQTLGTFRDATLTEPGGVIIYGGPNCAFRDIVYVPLDNAPTVATPAASAPVPAAAAGEQWRDWIAEERAAKNLDRFGYDDDGKQARPRSPHSSNWSKAFTARDGAVRASWKLSVELPGTFTQPAVHLRRSDLPGVNSGWYLAQIGAEDVRLKHAYLNEAGAILERDITKWPLPAGFDRTAEHTLELRAVGDLLSVRLNGKLLGKARDSALQSGGFGFFAAKDSAIRKMEYLSLDLPAGASANGTPITPVTAAKDAPFANTLGMKFVHVPITGGPTGGQRVLFSVWETRVQDYEVFATETKREWPKPKFEQGPTHPVVLVSFGDATAFCAWLTERERKTGKLSAAQAYRLPSDHEWSCAVGIGDREDPKEKPMQKNRRLPDDFPWGTAWPPPAGAGNFSGAEATGHEEAKEQKVLAGYRDEFPRTAPVGSFTPSPSGLHDLGGNVREYVLGSVDSDGKFVVRRGGTFQDSEREWLRSCTRASAEVDGRGVFTGFRIVLAPG